MDIGLLEQLKETMGEALEEIPTRGKFRWILNPWKLTFFLAEGKNV